jgi:hypothetical protein
MQINNILPAVDFLFLYDPAVRLDRRDDSFSIRVTGEVDLRNTMMTGEAVRNDLPMKTVVARKNGGGDGDDGGGDDVAVVATRTGGVVAGAGYRGITGN